MGNFEINAELGDNEKGIKNYQIFVNTINKVRNYYISHLGEDFMNKLDLYVDNATRDSGYTPVTISVLKKYVIIKLGITSDYSEESIAYQFAHELMHFVFHAKYGLDRKSNVDQEEAICSAASLVYIYKVYPKAFEDCNKHVRNLENASYRQGANIAKDIDYNFEELLKLV